MLPSGDRDIGNVIKRLQMVRGIGSGNVWNLSVCKKKKKEILKSEEW